VKGALTLRGRLTIGAVLMAFVLAIPLVVALRSLQRVHRTTLELRNGAFGASLLIGRLRQGTDDLRARETALLFVPNPASRNAMHAQIGAVRAMADSLSSYQLQSAATDVRLALDSLSVLTDEEYAEASTGGGVKAETISTQWVAPRLGVIEQSIASAENLLRTRARDRVSDATDETAAAERTALLALIGALLLAGLITLWLVRSISRPVYALEEGMHAVATGDFSHQLHMPIGRPDEFGRLSTSFESMATRLAQLDRMKAEFVSVASHELKTPINVILGYVELLQDGIYGPLTQQQREICETVAVQARNLTRLVRRLLDVSRFEAGGARLECRQMNLSRFLDALYASFSVLAMQRGVRFDIVRADGLPSEVRWDEDRMNEVVGNLLSNAFKFTPRGGQVQLTAAPLDGAVQLRVVDTGAGIPPDQLPRIFQKFFQADNQSKASGKGTGLGLAIAKEIVEAHGGSITAESTVGEGTTFTIVIPEKADMRRTGRFPQQRTAA
jgi:signal transduction histidine kinase